MPRERFGFFARAVEPDQILWGARGERAFDISIDKMENKYEYTQS
jgi:hypothetical protein